MDGYGLTAAIRIAEGGKIHMPIIAFTANALKGEAEHCREIGMDDYLSKPVQLVSLKAMLDKWLPVAAAAPQLRSGKVLIPELRERGTVNSRQASPSIAVDVNVLRSLVGNDDATLRDFLHEFQISAAKIADELRTACAARQAGIVGAAAHKLKSSARSVGALALGELCAEMEKYGKVNDHEALTALLPQFEQELATVERFIEQY